MSVKTRRQSSADRAQISGPGAELLRAARDAGCQSSVLLSAFLFRRRQSTSQQRNGCEHNRNQRSRIFRRGLNVRESDARVIT